MLIVFKQSDDIPEFHFDVKKLLLPSPEKRTQVLGLGMCRERDELERSRRPFKRYSFDDTVLKNFKQWEGENLDDFLNLYAPGLRKKVEKILEQNGLVPSSK